MVCSAIKEIKEERNDKYRYSCKTPGNEAAVEKNDRKGTIKKLRADNPKDALCFGLDNEVKTTISCEV